MFICPRHSIDRSWLLVWTMFMFSYIPTCSGWRHRLWWTGRRSPDCVAAARPFWRIYAVGLAHSRESRRTGRTPKRWPRPRALSFVWEEKQIKSTISMGWPPVGRELNELCAWGGGEYNWSKHRVRQVAAPDPLCVHLKVNRAHHKKPISSFCVCVCTVLYCSPPFFSPSFFLPKAHQRLSINRSAGRGT